MGGKKFPQKLRLHIDDKTVTNSSEIANGFNDYFISLSPQLANRITATVNLLSYVKTVNHSLDNIIVSCAEVERAIKSLNNSSAGRDEFSAFVANMCATNMVKPLAYLINSSLSSDIFPKSVT